MPGEPRIAAIIGAQRSGTTAIGRLAGTQPGVRYVGEIFHGARGPHDDPDYERFLLDPEANFFSFKERYLTRFPALIYPSAANQSAIWVAYRRHLFSLGDEKVWLIDIKYNSFHHLNPVWQDLYSWPLVLHLLASEKAPIIHLTRSDLFAQCVSALRAQALKVWHVTQGAAQNNAADTQVDIDPKELERRMGDSLHQRQHYANLFGRYSPKLVLEYETAFQDGDLSDGARTSVARLLGVEGPLKGPVGLKKVITRPLRELISNPGELRAHFAETKFRDAVEAHLGG